MSTGASQQLPAEASSSCAAPPLYATAPQLAGPQRLRKCASTPLLAAAADLPGMEVYVVLRSFEEFAGSFLRRLPPGARDGLRDTGVCHYMTVFRRGNGELFCFDFGPLGKDGEPSDIHVAHGPLARWLNKSSPDKHLRSKVVPGKIRERKVQMRSYVSAARPARRPA